MQSKHICRSRCDWHMHCMDLGCSAGRIKSLHIGAQYRPSDSTVEVLSSFAYCLAKVQGADGNILTCLGQRGLQLDLDGNLSAARALSVVEAAAAAVPAHAACGPGGLMSSPPLASSAQPSARASCGEAFAKIKAPMGNKASL